MLYETAIAAEIFGVDRSDLSPSGHWYDFFVATPDGNPSPWLASAPATPFDSLRVADTIVVPSTEDPTLEPDPMLTATLRTAYEEGVRIVALCTGSFLLAAAGLLDGRSAATHWMHADELARRYPRVTVRADVLYVDEGQVLTSAGKTAALDLCLHLVGRDHGASAANGLARRLVVPAHRPGGQAQFIAAPRDPNVGDRLGHALDWARSHLDEPISVGVLARQAGLGTRQLARRMKAELGSTPVQWLLQQRITRAQDLLERTDATIEQIATRSGMGTATTLRRHFQRAFGISPTTYRLTFRSDAWPASAAVETAGCAMEPGRP
jgi:transcriptional regulator GlxA family with amidase domain